MSSSTSRVGPGRAIWLDAAGTLLHPAVPVWEVYAAVASRHGPTVEAEHVRQRFGPAMRKHRAARSGDPSWAAFWRAVICESTGSDDDAVFRSLYAHYAKAEAWHVATGAVAGIDAARARGARVAVISNWDDRLRPLMLDLGLDAHLDLLVVSGEEGVEKPAPEIFLRAASRLAVPANCSVMFGDNPKNDVDGARNAGADAFLFGRDFNGFEEFFAAMI